MATQTRRNVFTLLFFVVMTVMLLSQTAYAIEFDEYVIPEKQANKYVYDVEDSISAEMESNIEEIAKELAKENVQLYVVSFVDLKTSDMNIYMLADDVLDAMSEESKETITMFVSKAEDKIIVDSTNRELVDSVGYIEKFHYSDDSYSVNLLNICKAIYNPFMTKKNVNTPVIEETTDADKEISFPPIVIATLVACFVVPATINTIIDVKRNS